MKVYPRSSWTAITPMTGLMADTYKGLPFFEKPPVGVEFVRTSERTLFLLREPGHELELLLKKALADAYADLDYNYAISQNSEGVYVIRGRITKCRESEKIRVLLLLGENEEPTDLLKQNQANFKELPKSPLPQPSLTLGDRNVHVFDLIEYLAEKGLYRGRNDGVFSEAVLLAMKELQFQLGHNNPTGVYDFWTYTRCRN